MGAGAQETLIFGHYARAALKTSRFDGFNFGAAILSLVSPDGKLVGTSTGNAKIIP